MEKIKLSQPQHAIFFAQLYEKEAHIFNQFGVTKINGRVSETNFKRTLAHLHKKHPLLRSVLKYDELEPFLSVLDDYDMIYEFKDFSWGNRDEREASVAAYLAQEKAFEFPLLDHLLFKNSLIKLSESEYIWIFNIHHLINDGWGISLLYNEVSTIYATEAYRQSAFDISLGYEAYLEFEHEYFQSNKYINDKIYWESKLSTLDLVNTHVGFSNYRSSLKGERYAINLPKDLSLSIQNFLSEKGISGHVFFLSVFYLYLFRLLRQSQITIGTPVLNRPKASLKQVMGMFVNFIPNTVNVHDTQVFEELLFAVQKEIKENFRHQRFPLNIVYKDQGIQREDVYPFLFNYQNSVHQSDFAGMASEQEWLFNGYEEHLLSLHVNDRNNSGKYQLNFDFNSSAVSTEEAGLHIDRFVCLLNTIVCFSEKPLSDYPFLLKNEETQIRSFLTGEAKLFEKTQLSVYLRANAQRLGTKIGVSDGSGTLNYSELEEKSNQVAHYFLSQGFSMGDTVCIELASSRELVIFMFALFKTGLVYVPIDRALPKVRKEFIKKDAQAVLTINNENCNQLLYNASLCSVIPPNVEINLHSVAYIIYTSGSTGVPKGVVVEHKQITHYVQQFIDYFKLSNMDRVAQQASISFDTSLEEILPVLCAGGTLVVFEKEDVTDIQKLQTKLVEDKISLFSTSPTVVGELNKVKFRSRYLKTLISGGDVLYSNQITNFSGSQVYNTYGPTETTICATYFPVGFNGYVYLGRPIANTSIFLLSEKNECVPLSAIGEICIAGEGLSAGYLNRKDLTEKSFISYKNKTLYRTGDLGRLLPNGVFEYCGRKDHQVNVHGHRIELGEIDNHLITHPEVEQSVTLVKETERVKNLVTYLVLKSDHDLADLKRFQRYLADRLPQYMVPLIIHVIEKMPLDQNGKVSKKLLAQLESCEKKLLNEQIIEPEELKLATIWKFLLESDEIYRNDHFFELGGHSITVTQLIKMIGNEFGVTLEFRDVFQHPVFSELFERIVNAPKSGLPALKPSAGIGNVHELSHAQKRLWALSQFEDSSIAYNIPLAYKLCGSVNIANFREAFNCIVRRHESLRTTFRSVEGVPKQFIHEAGEVEIEQIDLRENVEMLEDHVSKVLYTPFSLTEGPLYKIALIQISGNDYVFAFGMHHIIADGWSVAVLVNEFIALYQQLSNNKMAMGSPLDIQYKDYAYWHNALLESGLLNDSKAFWRNEFSDEIPLLDLPLDHPRLNTKSYSGSSVRHFISENLSKNIRLYCIKNDATLYMFLMACVNVLLYRISGNRDIVIGSPVAGRTDEQLDNQIGFYVNTLPLRTRLDEAWHFLELLENVKRKLFSAFQHQLYPFDAMVEDLKLPKRMNRNPLFDVMVVLQNTNITTPEFHEMTLEKYDYKRQYCLFDLSFDFAELGNTIELELYYNNRLFTESTVRTFIECFNELLIDVLSSPAQRISSLNLLSETHLKTLSSFQGSQPSDYEAITLTRLLQEAFRLYPGNSAVSYNQTVLTYRELDHKSNGLAIYLRDEYKLQRNDVVCVQLEKSEHLLITLIAILKSGAAYLPLEPNTPQERLNFILNDSNASLFIHQNKAYNTPVRHVDFSRINYSEQRHFPNANTPNDLAYILYTSGSTGKPKGVMVSHSAISQKLNAEKELYDLSENMVSIQTTNYVFDVSLLEFFLPLICGGKVVMPNQEKVLDPNYIQKLIDDQKVTDLQGSPTYINTLVETLANDGCLSLKRICLGGESLYRSLVNEIKNKLPQVMINNHYGPTEITIDAIVNPNISSFPFNNIGYPLKGTSVYILDKQFNSVPIGVYGNLYIGGAGLAKGYLNNKELTLEKFINYTNGHRPMRLYNTGDICRFRNDGSIEFLGREDQQVKIRGQRIELEEIESVIKEFPNINEAAVIVNKRNTEQSLVSFIVIQCESENRSGFDVRAIRVFLSNKLPAYMIPEKIIYINEMPLTASGKIDKKKLLGAIPDTDERDNPVMEPESPEEHVLLAMWKQILNESVISTLDNFFEMGGHSINAVKLKSMIYKSFHVDLELKDIFNKPTIKDLAKLIKSHDQSVFSEVTPVETRNAYPLSPAQKRMFILHQMDEHSIGYNMTLALKFEGVFKSEKVETVLKHLIQRHSSLRTVFKIEGDEVVQEIVSDFDFKLGRVQTDTENLETEIRSFIRPFNVFKPPFIRANVFGLSKQSHILVVDLCHMVTDGTSVSVLYNDFIALYNDRQLPPMLVDYKDFSVWQTQRFEAGALNAQEDYWLKVYENNIPVLDLPMDYSRPAVQSFEGDTIAFELDEELTKKIRALAKQTETTTFMVLFSAFNILLSRYSGREDIVVGTPLVGRTQSVLENVVGMFLNTLALRNFPKNDLTFLSFLESIKENCLKAFEYQEYPFEELVQKLHLDRDVSRNPLFDCMFNLLSKEISGFEQYRKDDLEILPFHLHDDSTKFDIYCNGYEYESVIQFSLGYATKLFKRETILRFIAHFKTILASVTKHPNQLISEINILPAVEEVKIRDYNENNILFSSPATIHERFELQVTKTPNTDAVSDKDITYTYSELNQRANQIAHYLREEYSVQPGDFIGICIERSVDMIAGILAIMKSGAAYVAIDPTYPEERILHMLHDSNTTVLLTDINRSNLYGNYSGKTCCLEAKAPAICMQPSTNLTQVNSGADAIYVVYTSGSTGTPNGAILSHSLLGNLLDWQAMQAGIDGSLTCLQFTSLNFCVSFQEIFSTLTSGGRLVLIDDLERRDVQYLMNFISDQKIETLYLPFSYLNFLFNEYDKWAENYRHELKHIVTAGEQLKISPALQRFLTQNPEIKLHNHYGSSEIHVVTSYTLSSENLYEYELPPVGKPIANTKIYILDGHLNLCPLGVYGNIYIQGGGEMLGYINNQLLTDEKFLVNHFDPKQKYYKTGDIGRWLPDGNIEYKGRKDKQLKIRGFRVEPGEIETLILLDAGVSNCVIIDKEDHQQQKYLVAYVVINEENFDRERLNRVLKNRFPSYMVPKLVTVDKIPLMPNGKVDREALPEPELFTEHTGAIVEPQTDLERKIADIWKTILSRDIIGVHENFFDLGGHSLRATQVISKLNQMFHVSIGITTFFQNPTVLGLAECVVNAQSLVYEPIPVAEHQAFYPLSNAQQRLWLLSHLDGVAEAYNMPLVFQFYGHLDIELFNKAFKQLIQRHESLRTTFQVIDGEPVQVVHTDIAFNVEHYPAKSDQTVDDILAIIHQDSNTAFHLETGPLMRAKLFECATNHYIFYFVMDHIISDAWSLRVLMNEVVQFYNHGAITLEPLMLQYKDYSIWFNKELEQGKLNQAKQFWLDRFKTVPTLNFPTDYQHPEHQSFKGNTLTRLFPVELNRQLNQMANSYGSSLFVLLLEAFNVLLYRYTNGSDFVIGTPIAGRERAELENQIGFYINTLALRTSFSKSDSVVELLTSMTQNTLLAYTHQSYPYDELIKDKHIGTGQNRRLFDVMFVLQNTDLAQFSENKLNNVRMEPFDFDPGISKYDFTITCTETQLGLEVNLEYRTDLFKESKMNILLERFEKILNGMIEMPEASIEDLCQNLDGQKEESDTLNFELNF